MPDRQHSWQLAKFIDGPRKDQFCWVYLTAERKVEKRDGKKATVTRSRPEVFDLSRYGSGFDRVVPVNAHCAKHYPGRLHGTRMEWLEMQHKGRNELYGSEAKFRASGARDSGDKPWMEDICVGEELGRRMFGGEKATDLA